jgi:hypothetical protein
MLPKTITTKELCEATGYSAPALVALEKSGVIARKAKDTWPLATLQKFVAHLRERAQRPKSEAEQRLINSKARINELRLEREAGDLCPTFAVENYGKSVFGKVRSEHVNLAPQFTRDLSERKRLADLVDAMDTRLADYFDAEGDALWQEAIKAGRRRA